MLPVGAALCRTPVQGNEAPDMLQPAVPRRQAAPGLRGQMSATRHKNAGSRRFGQLPAGSFAVPQSVLRSRNPTTEETGREKQIAPAFVPGPACWLMARMMGAFSSRCATM